jgi:hypothetical protein
MSQEGSRTNLFTMVAVAFISALLSLIALLLFDVRSGLKDVQTDITAIRLDVAKNYLPRTEFKDHLTNSTAK